MQSRTSVYSLDRCYPETATDSALEITETLMDMSGDESKAAYLVWSTAIVLQDFDIALNGKVSPGVFPI